MRTIIKLCSMLLVMALLVTSAKQITAFANVGSIQPRWSQTTSISIGLSIRNGTAYATGNVNGVIGKTTKINGFAYLQKKVNGSWNNIITWTATSTDWKLLLDGEKPNLSSGTYRVRFVAYVYEGSSVEEVEMISSEKTY